ncbi:hypothetical protein HanIR_Chr02g0074141 [Helianthus annuus]|nr:hypothetical protein HanIR_Chr02g0074141 [Helianthus annuus]
MNVPAVSVVSQTLAWRLDAPNLESYHARMGSLYCYCYKCICNVNRGR